jgi:hypothetical protein
VHDTVFVHSIHLGLFSILKLQDYLKTKIEQRPDRESLIQKNILSDSKAAPSLQEHQRKLKKARLVDDLNDKLLNRPGPLELVEYGILVSDTSLTEAIKGKLTSKAKQKEKEKFCFHAKERREQCESEYVK